MANNSSNGLLITSSVDGVTWNANQRVGTQSSAKTLAMVLFRNQLVIAYVANNNSNDLLITMSTNGIHWTPDAIVTSHQSSSHAPALAVCKDKLVLVYVANNPSNTLFVTLSANGAIRAYTHGYDMFNPSEALLWHEYARQGRRKHWEDHSETGVVALPWYERDGKSREDVRRFLEKPSVGHFGCGSERTFAEYTAYAGINFRLRKVEDYKRLGSEPPNSAPVEIWEDATRAWKIRIVLMRSGLPAEALEDPDFWYLGVHDLTGTEIYRQDLTSEELTPLLARNTHRIASHSNAASSLATFPPPGRSSQSPAALNGWKK